MKPQTVSMHLVKPHPEVITHLPNPGPGVFLANGKPARRPKDTHGFCAGGYVLWKNGAVAKRCIAAATQSGFAVIEALE